MIISRPGFISAREWEDLDDTQKAFWAQFVRDVGWLCDQPHFRRFAFTVLNEPRFCGTDNSPIRGTTEATYHAIGIQDAGRAIRLVLQSVAPRMWMKTMHEAFNALAGPPADPKEK